MLDRLSDYVYPNKELDEKALIKDIDKVIKPHRIDYDKWLKEFMDQWQGSAYFEQGNEKKSWTLDNLVDVTTGNVRGQEKTMTFGLNKARSFAHKQFNSIAEMKKYSDQLGDTDTVNELQEVQKNSFFKIGRAHV